MSFCGKVYCEIYRDKKYCTAGQKKAVEGTCKCRHAKRRCQVGEKCTFRMDCGGAEELDKLEDTLDDLREAVFGKTKGGDDET